ncbi:hypothetical protein VTL71DRAFT_5832 [Oculimacula yallundae]|uniref:Xylanolytic transcriptional activator regulatory domain-containing protein n=1 Tax=Oculimacula yallundae TaxID=86028 RepID=A0ABR4BYL3_9HELO
MCESPAIPLGFRVVDKLLWDAGQHQATCDQLATLAMHIRLLIGPSTSRLTKDPSRLLRIPPLFSSHSFDITSIINHISQDLFNVTCKAGSSVSDPKRSLTCHKASTSSSRKSMLLFTATHADQELDGSRPRRSYYDSLLRHLARHGDTYKPPPSGRSIKCKYRSEDEIPDEPQQHLEHPSVVTQTGSTETDGDATMTEAIAPTSTPHNAVSEGHKAPDSFKLPGPTGLVDWSEAKVLPDESPAFTEKPIDPTSTKYLDTYFKYFHHRWPIIHRPSFEGEGKNTIVMSSIKMVGAWLEGSSDSRRFAIMCRSIILVMPAFEKNFAPLHEALVEQLLPRLCKITSQDRLQQSLSLDLCQSALLNIIFAFYFGNDSAISGAIMLRNILIAGLREVGFFQKETAWMDEKPGFFVPMRLMRLGARQRLATYLFKVDAYLSILRDQPTVIFPEELHFSLPSVFGLYNAEGLHIWEERQANEPVHRSQISIWKMITQSSLEPVPGSDQQLLIEDIQTCICAMQPAIWKTCVANEPAFTAVVQKDTLRRQLDNLKARLNNVFSQPPGEVEFGHEKFLPLRCYFGYEDPSLPGWQNIVVARVKSLIFDTMMLYHLSSLQIFAEIRKITNLAKDRRLGEVEGASTIHSQARELRILEMRAWGSTPTARWCLCHAVDILVAHQNIAHEDGQLGLTMKTLDPIAHVALCTAALVVWVYSFLNVQGCEVCTPGAGQFIELKLWSTPGAIYEREKELWIENGDGYRVQLQGIQMCSCNVEYLMAIFQECLPDSWAAADSMAPGIFKFSA